VRTVSCVSNLGFRCKRFICCSVQPDSSWGLFFDDDLVDHIAEFSGELRKAGEGVGVCVVVCKGKVLSSYLAVTPVFIVDIRHLQKWFQQVLKPG
jgi:hypothetical protein